MAKHRETVKVFVGPSRPSHDSVPLATGELTDTEHRVLRDMIGRYMRKCRTRAERDAIKAEAHARAMKALTH